MSIDFEESLSGLSRDAAAVVATAVAMAFASRQAQVDPISIMRSLSMTGQEFGAALKEAMDAGQIADAEFDLVEAKVCVGLFMRSVGPAGRPSPKEWAKMRDWAFDKWGRACVYCDAEGDDLHVDHIVPVSRGGSNHIENLAPACPRCNVSKGGRLPHEWAGPRQ